MWVGEAFMALKANIHDVEKY